MKTCDVRLRGMIRPVQSKVHLVVRIYNQDRTGYDRIKNPRILSNLIHYLVNYGFKVGYFHIL